MKLCLQTATRRVSRLLPRSFASTAAGSTARGTISSQRPTAGLDGDRHVGGRQTDPILVRKRRQLLDEVCEEQALKNPNQVRGRPCGFQLAGCMQTVRATILLFHDGHEPHSVCSTRTIISKPGRPMVSLLLSHNGMALNARSHHGAALMPHDISIVSEYPFFPSCCVLSAD